MSRPIFFSAESTPFGSSATSSPLKKERVLPYVVIGSGGMLFAINSFCVREILVIPTVTPLPDTPEIVRGVINLRGSVLPLLDLRSWMKKITAKQETQALLDLLEARKQDHINWLIALEKSVREGTPFSLARDPTKCAFGKWYETYKPTDRTLASVLREFDLPHRKIHAIADKVCEKSESGDTASALAIIEETRHTDLSHMIELFGKAANAYIETRKELVIVLELEGKKISLAVDSVESVERIDASQMENLQTASANTLEHSISKAIKRPNSDQVVFLLNPECFFSSMLSVDGNLLDSLASTLSSPSAK